VHDLPKLPAPSSTPRVIASLAVASGNSGAVWQAIRCQPLRAPSSAAAPVATSSMDPTTPLQIHRHTTQSLTSTAVDVDAVCPLCAVMSAYAIRVSQPQLSWRTKLCARADRSKNMIAHYTVQSENSTRALTCRQAGPAAPQVHQALEEPVPVDHPHQGPSILLASHLDTCFQKCPACWP
jgi:hypothetical protein